MVDFIKTWQKVLKIKKLKYNYKKKLKQSGYKRLTKNAK